MALPFEPVAVALPLEKALLPELEPRKMASPLVAVALMLVNVL